MRTIAPSGFLHSFEFNEFRATRAQEEFEENALGGLVKVAHRDVCASRAEGGGFGEELDGKADAVFLDLPEPWLAVEHAKLALKPGKKVCSYSPCIEQVMKTCEALRSQGFHSVTTIEFRLRNINYTEVQLDVPDFGSIPPPTALTSATATTEAAAALSEAPSASTAPSAEGGDKNGAAHAGAQEEAAHEAQDGGGNVGGNRDAGLDSGRAATRTPQENQLAGEDGSNVSNVEVSVSGEKGNGAATEPTSALETKKRPREEEAGTGCPEGEAHGGVMLRVGRGRNERLPPKAALRAAEAAAEKRGTKKTPLKLVCAQPFPLMRGHTAFLTFAATPVSRQLGATGATAPTAEGAEGNSADGQRTSAASGRDVKSAWKGGPTGGNVGSGTGGFSATDVCEQERVDVQGKGKAKDLKTVDHLGEADGQVVGDKADSSALVDR
ncbi:unnamed protein product [Hapterophycus canaliculatus]